MFCSHLNVVAYLIVHTSIVLGLFRPLSLVSLKASPVKGFILDPPYKSYNYEDIILEY